MASRLQATCRVELTGLEDNSERDKLLDEITALILTRKHTMAGNNDYGMDCDFLDCVTPESINRFTAELDAEIRKWMPGIELVAVDMEPDELGAASLIRVTLDEEVM